MLGLSRASQYAGWWGGTPKFVSNSVIGVDSRSRYLDSFSLTPNAYTVPPATRSFDNTSLVNGAKGTQVVTFKYQAQSNYTWGTDSAASGYELIKNGSGSFAFFQPCNYAFSYQSTSNEWDMAPARTTTGNFLAWRSSYNAYNYFTLTGNLPWDTYADRWMTMIVSYSDTASDFANWTGTTGGTNYYQRMILQDAETGQLLSQTDSRYSAFQGFPTNWSTYTWSWDSGSPGSSTEARTQMNFFDAGGQFDQTDFLTTAGWMCQGTVIDPLATVNGVQLSQYFVGQCFPETVNSVRAWFNWTIFGSTTSGSDTIISKALTSRASQTNNYLIDSVTATLTTPITDTSIP
jgi:hypothetical protein